MLTMVISNTNYGKYGNLFILYYMIEFVKWSLYGNIIQIKNKVIVKLQVIEKINYNLTKFQVKDRGNHASYINQ